MANRKSGSNQATGAPRSPKPQPTTKNRSPNPAGNTASRPPPSSNQARKTWQTEVSPAAVPKSPQPQVPTNRSSNGSQGIGNGPQKSQFANGPTSTWIFGRGEASSGNRPSNNSGKAQGQGPVPQPNASPKPQAPKPKPLTGSHSPGTNSVNKPNNNSGKAQGQAPVPQRETRESSSSGWFSSREPKPSHVVNASQAPKPKPLTGSHFPEMNSVNKPSNKALIGHSPGTNSVNKPNNNSGKTQGRAPVPQRETRESSSWFPPTEPKPLHVANASQAPKPKPLTESHSPGMNSVNKPSNKAQGQAPVPHRESRESSSWFSSPELKPLHATNASPKPQAPKPKPESHSPGTNSANKPSNNSGKAKGQAPVPQHETRESSSWFPPPEPNPLHAANASPKPPAPKPKPESHSPEKNSVNKPNNNSGKAQGQAPVPQRETRESSSSGWFSSREPEPLHAANASPKPQAPKPKPESHSPGTNVVNKPSNNSGKAQGQAPVPQRETRESSSSSGWFSSHEPKPLHAVNASPKPQAPKPKPESRSPGKNSVPSSPPGNRNKVEQKVPQDQSSTAKQHERPRAHTQNAQHHPPNPQTTGFFSLFLSRQQPANSGKDTANGSSKVQKTTQPPARGGQSTQGAGSPLHHQNASSYSHPAQEVSNKGHKHNPPKSTTNGSFLGSSNTPLSPKNVPQPPIPSPEFKGPKHRSPDPTNHPKRDSSSGSPLTNMSAKQAPAASQSRGPWGWLSSLFSGAGQAPVPATTIPMENPSKIMRKGVEGLRNRPTGETEMSKSSMGIDRGAPKAPPKNASTPNRGSTNDKLGPQSRPIKKTLPKGNNHHVGRRKPLLIAKMESRHGRETSPIFSKVNGNITIPSADQSSGRGKPSSSWSMEPDAATSLTVISGRAQKAIQHQSVPGSSTVQVIKSPSAPRSKKFPVGLSSKKVLVPKKTTTAHRKGLLRQYTPTLTWRTSDAPKVVSAYSTLAAAPLPSPPKNELQNKVARKTITQYPDLVKIVSPIKVGAFEKHLKGHPNQGFVKSVVRALRHGFWPHADTSDPAFPTTYDGSRHRKPITNQDKAEFIRKQRDEEVQLERWSKPFGKKLLPGMHSSPIGAVPKSTPGKYRLIIDQSNGPHALNSTIEKRQVKPTLDNVHDLGTKLIAVRKKYPKRKLVLFKSDVKAAYRQLPVHPLWQMKQIVSIDGECHVDRCNTFGNRSGGWNWDSFASLVNWIGTEKKKITDLLGYVDDNFGWDFEGKTKYYAPYKKHFPAKQARLLRLWDELGIPHDEDKQLYGPSLPILGYEVDANAMTVKVPDEKMSRVVQLLRTHAHPGKSYTLNELQSAAGSTSAILSLYPRLRPGLKRLFAEMAGKEKPNTKLTVTEPVARSLTKLADYLERAPPVPIVEKK